MLSKWIRDGRFSVFFRAMLVLLDIIAINLSSDLALLVRFELRWSSIEYQCLEAVNKLCVFNTLVILKNYLNL